MRRFPVIRTSAIGLLLLASASAPCKFVEAAGRPLQLVGSEVYIEQPRKTHEGNAAGLGAKGGVTPLKPVEGPVLPTARQPESCDPQNSASQACYAATQQAHSVPR